MAVTVRRTKATALFWQLHRFLYRASGGRIGGRVVGMPVLLLTTRGRKTGVPRSNVLTHLPKGRAAVVFASNAGEPTHPAWWLNLRADPHATVQRGRDVVAVVAREAEGDERQALWDEVVRVSPGYAEYARRTTRRIPVVVLAPVEPAATAVPR